MIKVWTDAAEAGLLDRHGERGSTFAYLPGAPPTREVSVTMPLRLESWSAPFGLLPVFEMNLPEGVLRERLRLAFAKATGSFDDFDLLSIVGRSQVGRIRYTGDKEDLPEDVPFQSVDEILERRRGGDLFRYRLEHFASFSGIRGVQPKILVRDEKAFAEMEHTGYHLSQNYKGATHIVKMWEPNEYPQLAANEYFCLTVARKYGLDVHPGSHPDGHFHSREAAARIGKSDFKSYAGTLFAGFTTLPEIPQDDVVAQFGIPRGDVSLDVQDGQSVHAALV